MKQLLNLKISQAENQLLITKMGTDMKVLLILPHICHKAMGNSLGPMEATRKANGNKGNFMDMAFKFGNY